MGVVAGSPVSAANTNQAFLDANADDTGVGIYTFANTMPASGPTINNMQAGENATLIATGASESNFTQGVDYTGAPASTITTGQSHRSALVTLAQKFDPVTGHAHTGSAGDGPPITYGSLSGTQLSGFPIQGTNLTGVSGGSTDVSSQLSSAAVSTTQFMLGVVANAPYNYTSLFDANDDSFLDSTGNKVYGRLTNSGGMGGTWTLTYFSDVGGVQTPYSFPSPVTVKWFYQQLFNEATRPVYSTELVQVSDQVAGIVPNATATVPGIAVLGVHTLQEFIEGVPIIGDITLKGGTGVTITRSSQTFQFDSTASIGFQETPTGTVNGVNATFGPLTNTPLNQASIIVTVDGIFLPVTTAWVLTGSSIVFQSGWIPAFGQNVYVWYLYNGLPPTPPPPPSGVENVEYHTVTSGEAIAKTFTLSATPASSVKVLVDIIGGGPQMLFTDFTIAGNNFNWSGLGLDGVLIAGDVVRLHYFS